MPSARSTGVARKLSVDHRRPAPAALQLTAGCARRSSALRNDTTVRARVAKGRRRAHRGVVAASGCDEKEKGAPRRDGGEGDGGAADLESHRRPAQVLSSAGQKKGARAALGNETALQ